MDTSPELFWNEKFAGEEYLYGTSPNQTLREWEPRLPRGADILCVADGEGRNGVFLAERGHRVTSVDASGRALGKARALAAARGTHVHTVQGDLREFDAGRAQWDAVVLVFFHPDPADRRFLFSEWIQALRPGGILLMEGYAREQAGMGTGGPSDPAVMWTMDEIRRELNALANLEVTPHTRVLSEGKGHRGTSHLLRVWGRK